MPSSQLLPDPPPDFFQILHTFLLTQVYVLFLSFKRNKRKNNPQKHRKENQINRKQIKHPHPHAHK